MRQPRSKWLSLRQSIFGIAIGYNATLIDYHGEAITSTNTFPKDILALKANI